MLSGNKYMSRSSFGSVFLSVSNRYQKKTIYLLVVPAYTASTFRDWVKRLQKCFSKGGIL